MVEPIFKRLVIIGIGLIGSSIARDAAACLVAGSELVICHADPGDA